MRSYIIIYKTRGHDGPGAQGRRARLRARVERRPVQRAQVRPGHQDRRQGSANGWTQLAFNGYGTDTGKTIPNGGPSTKALLDPAFRDALGYAVDHQALVDRVLGGYGDVGTTIVPPVLRPVARRARPRPRTFDIELAKQKLDAAGYTLDADGQRLDKEGKPIKLRLFMPGLGRELPEGRPVHRGLVRRARDQGHDPGPDSAMLGEKILPPEAGDKKYTADYDIELWGWSGGIDPNGLLQVFRCEEIGTSSDSQYCNPATTRCTRTS